MAALNKNGQRISKNHFDTGKNISSDDLHHFEQLKDILKLLQEKHKLSEKEISKLLNEELQFPTSIFVKELTVLHALVKYLKENKNFTLAKIAAFIGRDQRNVWRMYSDAAKKSPQPLNMESELWLPISIVQDEKLSAQESIVKYLKEEYNKSFVQIAGILHKDVRTVWTVYKRSQKKTQ